MAHVEQVAGKRDKKAVSSPYLHKLQRRHFVLFDILPTLGTVGALWLAFTVRPPTALDLTLFAVMWALTGFSISIGFHRLFTHRAFKTSAPVRVLLTVFGCMAARSSMITWTSQHRRHHELADHEGDVHSPNLFGQTWRLRLKGLWYSHFSWMLKHEYPNVVHYVPDLLADKAIMKADRGYLRWAVLGLVLPGVIAGALTQSWLGALTGFLWGGVVRQFVVAQQVSALNSLTHMFGTRMFKMKDNHSHNNALFGLITWGEGWHNNHHAFPDSANFGFRWYQLDPGYWIIRVMEAVGLVWDVKRPDAERIAGRIQRLEALDEPAAEPTAGARMPG
ncbi:stearoyl-CoA desaturase (delta-9 desaturase) [Myxococcus fulvus]|uniref:Fatty acid desaturase n=1 Tax=Myxococcus fulvus TaxID=33 RepID=A0A511TF11_MYXFU|nr:acyl-CoA desaturase [Myxococcus fulvus]GEN12233.1 fatty acid desaturase [Myxococcus fulvus]SEU27131.1 stearoyl-CoA desaturase (delta-9 desaturase) [Myxococcus fulvus]